MSYCRKDGITSDVYVIKHTDGKLCCIGCEMCPEPGFEAEFFKTADMVEHLKHHLTFGHRVPDYAFDRLEAHAESTDAWMKWQQYYRKGQPGVGGR